MRRVAVLRAVAAAGGVVIVAVLGLLINLLTAAPGNWVLIGGAVASVMVAAAIEAGLVIVGGPGRRVRPGDDGAPDLDGPVVARPEKLDELIAALSSADRRSGQAVAIVGFGGYGKTTLAKIAIRDARVRTRLTPYFLTLGEGVGGAALAERINDLTGRISGVRPGYTTVEQAGQHLGEELDAMIETHGPVLIVVDDVWTAEQARAFLHRGRQCTRLFTTRMANALPAIVHQVQLGPMPDDQSHNLLSSGVPGLSARPARRLVELAGHWPLLLALAKGILRHEVDLGEDPDTVAERLGNRLDQSGPTALDFADEIRRERAAQLTIDASLDTMPAIDRERLVDLAIFAEDARIPEHLVQRLWRETGGLSAEQTTQLCRRLRGMSLLAEHDEGEQVIQLHDVIRNYLRARGAFRIPALNAVLLDAAEVIGGWWLMPTDQAYLWRYLGYHMREAGRAGQFTAVATDLRWAMTKLRLFGAAAVSDDLAGLDGAATAMRHALLQHGHLLAPTDPPHAVVDVFLGRVRDDPELSGLVAGYNPLVTGPRLVPRWPLPDLPHAALHRVLPDVLDTGSLNPPTSWDGRLVLTSAAGADAVLRGVDDGEPYVVLADSADATSPVVHARDGAWIAMKTPEHRMQLWDTATGRRTVTLDGHSWDMTTAIASPDGRWLVACTSDGRGWLWPTAGGPARPLHGHRKDVTGFAFAPDSSWVATHGDDDTVRIWMVGEHRTPRVLSGHTGAVTLASTIVPDLLLTADNNNAVRAWDTRTFASPADGAWLAIAETDRVTRWDRLTWKMLSTGHVEETEVTCLAVDAGGTSVAAGLDDGRICVWDVATDALRGVLDRHGAAVRACAFREDGVLISTGGDGARLWRLSNLGDYEVGTADRQHPATAVAVAADGDWLATAHDKQLRFWRGDTAHVTSGTPDYTIESLLAVNAGTLAVGRSYRELELWDVRLQEIRSTVEGQDYGAMHSTALLSPDRVAAGGYRHQVTVYDLRTSQAVVVLDHLRGRVVHPTRRSGRVRRSWLRARAAVDGRISQLRPSDVGRLAALRRGLRRLLREEVWWFAVVGFRDGTRLATVGNNGTFRLWHTDTWESIAWQDDAARHSTVTDSETGLLFTAKKLIQCRPHDGKAIRTVATLADDDGDLSSLATSADGKYIGAVTGTKRSVVIVWEAATWRRIAMQRVDGSLSACAWTGHDLVAVGSRGVYRFTICE